MMFVQTLDHPRLARADGVGPVAYRCMLSRYHQAAASFAQLSAAPPNRSPAPLQILLVSIYKSTLHTAPLR